jgi:hypothetical protein
MWEGGKRIYQAWFMKDTVHDHLGVPRPTWVNYEDYIALISLEHWSSSSRMISQAVSNHLGPNWNVTVQNKICCFTIWGLLEDLSGNLGKSRANKLPEVVQIDTRNCINNTVYGTQINSYCSDELVPIIKTFNQEPECYEEKDSQEKAVQCQGNGVCYLQVKEGENKAFFEECFSVSLSLRATTSFSKQIKMWLRVPI